MDEQRFQAYVALIEQLLRCADDKEIVAILQQQAELVDPELLAVMQQYAGWLEQQGNPQAAEWLRETAAQLAQAMGITVAGNTEQSAHFFVGTLQFVEGVDGDPEQVYPFLTQYQNELNETLLQTIPMVVENLLEGNLEQRQSVASALAKFGNLVQEFPLGQRWLNLELAIVSYQFALQVHTHKASPQIWGIIQNNLAFAYTNRILGEHTENLEKAIEICELASQVLSSQTYVEEWAMLQMNLAVAYHKRIQGARADNLEKAITTYQIALQVFKRKRKFPRELALVQSNLAVAYTDRILGNHADNLEQAISILKLLLQTLTPIAFPREWVQAQANLANAYLKRVLGERAENIEKAIEACQLALQIHTREASPQGWALVQHNLAGAYANRVLGERVENLEKAIQAYQLALQVHTRETAPREWARTQRGLADVYRNRILGERGENLEKAIEAYQLALQVYTREVFPREWAEIHGNLANVYGVRIQGDRAENLEQSIVAAQLALQVHTRESFPQEWAATHVELGVSYRERIRGDRAENFEQAIDGYQRALQVYTFEAFPEKWATIQLNLTSAYSDRVRGEYGKNLEEAIAAAQLALKVVTRDTFPRLWAKAQRNLAGAYYKRIQGDHAENLEQSIAITEQVLTAITRETSPQEWGTSQMSLAIAYHARIQGERTHNLEQAIIAAQFALQILTRDAFPEEWAKTQMILAQIYQDRIQGKHTENVKKSVAAAHLSLQIFTPETFPYECRMASRLLGALYFKQQAWTEANYVYATALQSSEILYQSAVMLDSKAAELAETSNLPRLASYALARTGNLQLAALTLEQGRARGLSESLDRDRSNLSQLQQTYPALFTQYQEITAQLRNLEAQQRLRMTSEERHSLTPEAFRTEALRLRQILTETIGQIRQVEGYANFLAQPDFDDIRQAVRTGIPLVYLVTTPNGSIALIVTQTSVADLRLDNLTEASLGELLVIWFDAYNQSQTNRLAWLDAIDQVTHQLWQPLMAPLIDHLKQHSFQQATLVPTGYLSLLPLHAAWTEDPTTPTGRCYALDEILFTYAPNARSINAAREIAQRTGADSILAINEPKHRYQDSVGNYKDVDSLPNSTREVQAAIATFQNPKVLHYEQATREAVLAVLPHVNVLHCSCHGKANLQEPLESGLAMTGDGRAAVLTLRDLLDLKLVDNNQSGIRLAVLSACETGLTGTELADEAIGLPTGLLQAGVAGVVASLWEVSDLSTMMLLVRFYDYSPT